MQGPLFRFKLRQAGDMKPITAVPGNTASASFVQPQLVGTKIRFPLHFWKWLRAGAGEMSLQDWALSAPAEDRSSVPPTPAGGLRTTHNSFFLTSLGTQVPVFTHARSHINNDSSFFFSFFKSRRAGRLVHWVKDVLHTHQSWVWFPTRL